MRAPFLLYVWRGRAIPAPLFTVQFFLWIAKGKAIGIAYFENLFPGGRRGWAGPLGVPGEMHPRPPLLPRFVLFPTRFSTNSTLGPVSGSQPGGQNLTT